MVLATVIMNALYLVVETRTKVGERGINDPPVKLAVTMLTSLLVSTLFFMALLALIGPSDPHQQGSVRGAAQGLQQLVLGLGK